MSAQVLAQRERGEEPEDSNESEKGSATAQVSPNASQILVWPLISSRPGQAPVPADDGRADDPGERETTRGIELAQRAHKHHRRLPSKVWPAHA